MAYIYVTENRFCSDDSTALRIFTFCKILHESGKDVIVISLDENVNHVIHQYKGIKYITLRSPSNSFLSRLLNLVLHTNRLKKSLRMLSKDYDIENIFFYDIPPLSTLYLKRYAKTKKVKIFHDSVEWYSPQQFTWGRLAIPYMLKDLLNRYLLDRQVKVIAISKYLYSYFHSKGIAVTRIPIVLDLETVNAQKNIPTAKLILMYAGSPGKKDYLNEMVEGLSMLNQEELNRIEFNIFGVTETQLSKQCNVSSEAIRKCGASLVIHGRVTREKVMKYLQTADFTILLRSTELRYAKAGFPTKVVESLATGTPVICNITSDLGEFLTDGKDALIVDSCSPNAFKEAIQRALKISPTEKQLMFRNARETAEHNFDYKIYLEQFSSFIKGGNTSVN